MATSAHILLGDIVRMHTRCKRNALVLCSNVQCRRRVDLANARNITTKAKEKPHIQANKTAKWKSVVGLEIHAQITSASKLFSGSSTIYGSAVNCNVSLFDAAIPGTLPVLNKRCVEAAVLTSLALQCKVNPVSQFDRKHYFYADLPAGYQITQQSVPLAENGKLQFYVFTPGVHRKPYIKTSIIKQLQLEQDSGKSLHDDELQRSLIDLNRAGLPLMELVFEPDLEDGEEAAALVKELTLILRRLRTCSCKMEEGALRVDANVSVHEEGKPLGVRTEIKNIGSIRGVANAVQYEIARQINVLEHGNVVINETRAWDAVDRQTVPMRDKEEKQDYRYMPEPNLPPLRLFVNGNPVCTGSEKLINVNMLQRDIPELPDETRQKLISQYGLSTEIVMILVNEDVLLQYFFTIMQKENRNPTMTANILVMDLLEILHKSKISVDECTAKPDSLGELIDLLQDGRINKLTAKKLLHEIIAGDNRDPSQIVAENGWQQITDESEIKKICENILEKNPSLVKQYKSGKVKLFSAFLGQIAKETQNRANMATVTKQLKDMLSR